jgi:hypothetical protein
MQISFNLAGFCTPSDISNEGTRFILSKFRPANHGHEHVTLRIQNPHTTDVYVSARHSMSTTIDGNHWLVKPQSVWLISIPQEFGLDEASQIAHTAFEIISTSPIKINMINSIQSLFDKSTGIFPYPELGRRYTIITQCRAAHTYSKVHIVSSSVITNVQIKLPGESQTHFLMLDGKNFHGGDKINVDLGQYSLLQLTSQESLSGTTISSSDIVSVFAGCDFSYTHYLTSQNTDQFYHNFEHIVDDTRLGRDFDFVPFEECNMTAIAPFGNTTILLSVNDSCEVNTLMNDAELGETYIFPGSVVTVHSNNPILVSVDAGRNFFTFLTPREQGIFKTSFCGYASMPVKFLIYGKQECTPNFWINSELMEIGKDIFEQYCYDENTRCFFTSRMYMTTLPCYTFKNDCGAFSGSVQTHMAGSAEREESLGNAMLIMSPVSTLQRQKHHSS